MQRVRVPAFFLFSSFFTLLQPITYKSHSLCGRPIIPLVRGKSGARVKRGECRGEETPFPLHSTRFARPPEFLIPCYSSACQGSYDKNFVDFWIWITLVTWGDLRNLLRATPLKSGQSTSKQPAKPSLSFCSVIYQ